MQTSGFRMQNESRHLSEINVEWNERVLAIFLIWIEPVSNTFNMERTCKQNFECGIIVGLSNI